MTSGNIFFFPIKNTNQQGWFWEIILLLILVLLFFSLLIALNLNVIFIIFEFGLHSIFYYLQLFGHFF